jgi:hypothetical protein
MIGKCFVIWGEDGVVQYQGAVKEELPGGYYLTQFFDFIMGEPNTWAVFHIDKFAVQPLKHREPGDFTFFDDDEHLRDWIDRHG